MRRRPVWMSVAILGSLAGTISCSGIARLFAAETVYVQTDVLAEAEREEVDSVVSPFLESYRYINLALVCDGMTVYVASYGADRTGSREIYASVSKPVTATIAARLVESGIIDLDEPIGTFTDRFDTIVPEQYEGADITIRQLLTHQGGLPGQAPLVRPRPWPFLFEPGSGTSYSTWGYGLLGAVLEDATGMSYDELVKAHAGAPVGAESFRADSFFDSPGGRVWSTIDDMARFAVGIMNGAYQSDEYLRNEILAAYGSDGSGTIGLGWYVSNPGLDNAALYHAGSNGAPRAFLAVQPFTGRAVCIAGRNRDRNGVDDFGALAVELMQVIGGSQ